MASRSALVLSRLAQRNRQRVRNRRAIARRRPPVFESIESRLLLAGDAALALSLPALDVTADAELPAVVDVPVPSDPADSTTAAGDGATVGDHDRVSEVQEADTIRAAPTSPFTVQGQLEYTDKDADRNGLTGTRTNLPIRYATVEIWEDDASGDSLLGTTYTGADGTWSFLVPGNDDASGRDLYVRVIAETEAGIVHDPAGNAYVYTGPTVTDWQGGAMWYDANPLDATSEPVRPATDVVHAAFNILDQLVGSYEFLAAFGENPGQVQVQYGAGGTDGSYYQGGVITLLGLLDDADDGFDDSVIRHEYGHFVADQISYDKSPGGPHTWGSHISRELAWSEGWATFFAGATLDQSYYVDVAFDSSMIQDGWLDVSLESPEGYALTGDGVEGAIALVLWDIFDPANEPHDTMAAGADEIIAIVSDPAYFSASTTCTLADFYEGWRGLGYADLEGLRVILAERSIVYWPTIESVTGAPDPATPADGVTLTANGVTATRAIAGVSFYRESNGTAGLQTGAGGDTHVGNDTSASDGWTVTVSTDGLAPGAYTYYAIAEDVSGDTSGAGTAAVSTTSTIQDAAPSTLTASLTGTPSGFEVTFSGAIDASVLNLYDAQSVAMGPADVTLVGAATGAVRGTLFVEDGGQQLVFVRTGGVLAADTYTVILRSAADGIKATDGMLLDGNGDGVPGDDYVGSFDVAVTPGVVVSIPDFARGPGQPVDVPASGTGLPIRITSSGGVDRVDLLLDYDPALLELTAVAPGVALPDGATVTFDLSTPGRAEIHVSLPAPLASGSFDLVTLTAAVRSTALYRAREILDIVSLSVNGGAIPAVADDGVHVVAYLGDTTGNGGYSSLDGQRVLRVAVGLDTGFGAFPLVDPVILADITGDSAISSLDATRILQEAVGFDPAEIPDRPASMPALAFAGADPAVKMDASVSGAPGDVVTVPVNVAGTAAGIATVDLELRDDPTVLGLDPGGVVRPGSLTQGAVVAHSVGENAGRITIALGLPEPLTGGAGSLVEIDDRIRAGASAGSTRIHLVSVSLNEDALAVGPDVPQPGPDATNGEVEVQRGNKDRRTPSLLAFRMEPARGAEDDELLPPALIDWGA